VFPVLDNARLNPNYVDSVLEMHLGTPSPFEIPSSSSSSSSSSATLFSAAAAAGARSFSYETGDHVGVYPRNDPDLISRLAARCGFDLDDVLTTHTTPTKKSPLPGGLTEREALTYGLEVQSAPKVQAVRELAAAARDPKERRMLEQLVQQPQLYREYVWKDDRHVIGLLEEFPSIDLSFLTLAQHVLPPIQPRFYSISSSSLQYPEDVHVTYRWVHYKAVSGAERQGVSTSYLKTLSPTAPAGTEQEAFGFMRTSSFRQPSSPDTPVVMIAGGSGIAPLKAFLQERLFLVKTPGVRYGPGILLFGIRNPDDLVYSSLIQDCLKTGALTEAHISFSSPPNPSSPHQYEPRFVAADITNNAPSIWKALSDGAYVYMCGGASAFAATCVKSLKGVIQTRGKLDAQGSEDYLLSLMRQRRYMEDLSD